MFAHKSHFAACHQSAVRVFERRVCSEKTLRDDETKQTFIVSNVEGEEKLCSISSVRLQKFLTELLIY